MKFKVCTVCNERKNLDDFHKRKTGPLGRKSACKKCRSERRKNQKPVKYENLNEKKRCTVCSKSKNLSKFYKSKLNRTDGRSPRCKSCRHEYEKKRRREDDDYRFRKILRKNIWRVFKEIKKDKKTVKLLGCSFEKAKNILIDTATEDFTWEMLGQEYHLDHIIPLASFDLTKEVHRRAACHYTNLQILTAEENLSKSASVPEGFDIDEHVKQWLEEYG